MFLAMPRAFYILLVMISWIPATAQLPERLRFDNLGIDKGLSQSTVYCMLQDRQGYIWIGTDDGVNRYDGYKFQIYRPRAADSGALPAGSCLGMLEDKQGRVWFRHENVIAYYEPETDDLTTVSTLKIVSDNTRRNMMSDGGNCLYFKHGGHLCSMEKKNGHISNVELPDIVQPSLLGALPDGSLIIASQAELWLYDPVTRQARSLKIPVEGQLNGAFPAGNDRIWIENDGCAACYDVSTGRLIHKVAADKHILCACFDQFGYLWLGSEKGLTCVDTATLQTHFYTNDPLNSQSLAGRMVRSIVLDRGGILWIGTNEGGISKLSRQKIKFDGISVSTPQVPGLSGGAALSFAEDGAGNVWIGNDNGDITICETKSGHIVQSALHTGIQEAVLSLLRVDKKMYYGHTHGIGCISINTKKQVGVQQSITTAKIKSLHALPDGTVVAVGARCIYRKPPASTLFSLLSMPESGTLLRLFIASDGTIWLSESADLIRMTADGTILKHYAPQFPRFFTGNEIYDMKQDRAGVLWLSCNGVGILRYDAQHDSFLLALPSNALPNANIYAMETDSNNGLWLSTNAGLCRYDTRKGSVTSFTHADGLLSNEGIGRASLKDSYGNIWFGNIGGCNIIHPSVIPRNSIPPQPCITAFRLFDRSVPVAQLLKDGKGIHLKQSDNYFTIEFSAMDYTQPDANKYRFMLKGFDKTWRALTAANSVSYTNLDGGNYTFQLIAYNSDGVPARSIIALPIYIKPYFYYTWWFYALVVLVISGAMAGFYQYRVRQLKREIKLRTSIASDLHDDVGATLSSIKMLTAMLQPRIAGQEEAKGIVNTIQQRAATTLEAMSDIVWSINPKNDAADNLVLRMKTYAAEMLDETELDYRFDIAPGIEQLRLTQHKRKEIYLIFKESLNNALKFAEATSIVVQVARPGHLLTLSISDNGKGFVRQSTPTTTKGGNGLKNMEDRARGMKGTLQVDSTPGQGTRLFLSVPLP